MCCHTTSLTYDHDTGAPLSVTDPNNNTTAATYDQFGRITSVTRPGDSSATMTFTYNNYAGASAPFYTQVTQRIDTNLNFSLRKYYSGLGQVLQTQVMNAKIGANTRDIRVDTYYDAAGRAWRQSVPYDTATGLGYNRSATLFTTTTYDDVSRPLSVLAPDGSETTRYEYPESVIGKPTYSGVRVRDANGNWTTTYTDVWGRTTEVHPPLEPWTHYIYDAADRLTKVEQMNGTNALAGFTTSLTYDFAGRKIGMNDPDMGVWTYTYDLFGNLKTQTDARGCTLTMTYDILNRLTAKNSSGSCGTQVSTTYTYDTGSNGIGKRTRMDDASGNTTWTYDARGRLATENKNITGAGTFQTAWTYYSNDAVRTMIYPDGESVSYEYLPQGALKKVNGTATYVPDVQYDAAGRMTVLKLGSALTTEYTYFAWNAINGVGRLQQIKTTKPDNSALLQFAYTYDANSNITTILDTPNSEQKQCFQYDALNRLIVAAEGDNKPACSGVSGANGVYPDESYTYNVQNGNLASKAGLTYTYNTLHKHAVQRVHGTGGTNKTITIRAYGTICGDTTPGTGPTMELWVNGVQKSIWTNVSTNWTNYNATVPLTGKDLVEVVFTNDCYQNGKDRNLFVDYVVIDGQTIQAEGGTTVLDKGASTSAFDGLNVIAGQQELYWSGALRFATDKAMDVGYDSNGNMTHRLVAGNAYFMAYDAENHLTTVQRGTTTIATFTYDGDGNRVKSVLNNQTTLFIGEHYQKEGSLVTKYYFAGSQRIAMRQGSTVNYLVNDHLGSASVTYNASTGAAVTQLYKPWGEVRYTSGALPTDYTYTGQYSNTADFGLMYYRARWYDPSLGRFSQADTIVPLASQGSQAWDRYAYVNNNPLRYSDPSGRGACDGKYQVDECGEIDPDGNGKIELRKIDEWEIKLLTAAILADASRGSIPSEWNVIMAWTYLNRITLNTSRPGSPGWSERAFPLWESVKSSAFAEWYLIFPLPDNIKDKGLQADEVDDFDAYLDNMKNKYKYPSAWEKVERDVRQAVHDWTEFKIDPSGGATDYFHVLSVDYETSLKAQNDLADSKSGYKYRVFGPEYVGEPLNKTYYLFTNNWSTIR